MISTDQVMRVLEGVIDPELGLDVVSLGMIRNVSVDGGRVSVGMTLTTATCPFWELFVEQVRIAILALPDANEVRVDYIRHPPWHPDVMTPEARRVLDQQGILPIFFRDEGLKSQAWARVNWEAGASSTKKAT